VEVRYDEGLANHIGPEPCASAREGRGEASVGVRIGQPLSRESPNWDADAVIVAEGKTGTRVNASASTVPRGRRPWHVRKLPAREPGGLMTGRAAIAAPVRVGGRLLRNRLGKARSRSRR
jgi:hypothetical protein